MASPFIFNGQRPKALTSKGPLLQSGTTLDNDGVKNYLVNGGGELGLTTGWSAFNTTFDATGVPQTITAGSTKLSIANVNTNVIRGTYSNQMNITTVASSAGHGIISDIFTVENEDLAKVLQTTFEYTFASGGTNCDVSGTSTSTFEFWVYNVGLAAWTQPAGYRSILQNSGFAKTSFTFQTDSSSASNKNQYRIAILIKNAPSAAAALNFEASCGPQPIAYASVTQEMLAYTPTFTGFGTVSNVSFFSARVGDRLKVIGSFTAGTTTATEARISLGYSGGNGNVTVDSIKVPTIRGVGSWYIDTTTVTTYKAILAEPNFSYVTFGFNNTTTAELAKQNASTIVSAGVKVSVDFEVPIVGWGTNQILSQDADQRAVRATITSTSTQSVTSSASKFQFNTVQKDSHGGFDPTTNYRYSVSVPGTYHFDGAVLYGAAGALLTSVVYLYKNGSQLRTVQLSAASGAQYGVPFSFQDDANCGDYYEIFVSNSTTTSAISGSTLNIFKESGNSQILAADTVACRYYGSTQSIANTGAVVINFGTKDYDTTGSVTTGTSWVFTAPVSGKYHIDANVYGQAAVWTAGQVAYLSIYKNPTFTPSGSNQAISTGTRFTDGVLFSAFNATMTLGLSVEGKPYLNAGETICITMTQNRTGGDVLVDTNSYRCNVEINRIGN